MDTPDTKPRSQTTTRRGMVVSDKRSRTRTVQVTYLTRDPKYGKYLRRNSRYQVHDADDSSAAGDLVEIASCRPLSKTKSWRLLRIVERAVGPEPTAVEAPSTE